MHRVFLSLGSNLGKREQQLEQSMLLMERVAGRVVCRSANYWSKAWGMQRKSDFINACVEIRTPLDPRDLLFRLQWMERKLGRTKLFRWGPRSIDIDILLFDRLQYQDAVLQIPHPQMHRRLFVLAPLAEIAPRAWHPVLKMRVIRLKQRMNEAGKVLRLEP
jgi:2-amino-4-hydroxy-6-hydroxymethyldihydropteridine diphosphokinase